MAVSLRIDSAALTPAGALDFTVTLGPPPLPLGPGSEGLSFPGGREQFAQALAAWEAGLDAQTLLFIACSAGLKADPQLRPTTIAAWRGRTVTVDFSGAVQAITL